MGVKPQHSRARGLAFMLQVRLTQVKVSGGVQKSHQCPGVITADQDLLPHSSL